MAYTGVVTAKCPECGEEFETEVWSVVRGDRDIEVAERLMAGEINFVGCPKCEKVFYYEHMVIFLDPARELMAFIYPESFKDDEPRWRAQMAEDHTRFQAGLIEKDRHLWKPSLFFGVQAFEEHMATENRLITEWEVAAAVSVELGLDLYVVYASYAREHGVPGYLPLKPGAGALRERMIAGLKTLVASNDRLEQYVAFLRTIEKKWEEPPGRERQNKRGR